MNPTVQLVPPEHMLMIAFIIGGVIRILKTKTVGDLLDWLPVSWVKAIPPRALPWLALMLAAGTTVLDGHFNQGLPWKDAGWLAAQGVFSGSLAVAGHETVAKQIGKVIYSGPTAMLALLSAFLALPVTGGCAAFGSALPHIIAAIVDGGQIIDRIADYLAKWFALHPDPIIQPKVELAIQKCRKALSIALHAAEGTDKLDQAKVDAAFDDFKKAYLELIELARPYGVNTEGQHAFKASPDGQLLVVPEPLALKPVPR